jgi:protein-glutamine gamma-glutamyltransferase
MTFVRYFKAASYCLIGSGFAAIAATGAIAATSIILFSIILIVSWFIDTGRLRHRTPTWALNVLALLCLFFFAVDYRLLSHSFLIAALHLLFIAASAKLLTLSKDRDCLQLYLISFAELLAASILAASLVVIFCFLIFFLSGICTFMLFEMRRSNARIRGEARLQPIVASAKLQGTGLELFAPFPAGIMSAMAFSIALMIVGGAIPLFFFLPRITLGLNRQPSGTTQFISGFSDHVELGQIGSIKLSNTIVMRVKTDKPPSELPPNLKWRGLALDYFDGRAWKRSNAIRQIPPIQGWFYKLENSVQGTNLINQTFFIEPLSTDVIFAAHKALAVSMDIGSLQRDSANNLYTTQYFQKKLRYFAVSDPIRPDPAKIADSAPIPPEIRSAYLQLPSEDPRIADLTGRVTETITGGYAKALAIEAYLRSHYSYSLVLRGTPNSKDPLAMFLFTIREGHCEYFASAMTVMLRQIGIPARLVNGFLAGEYNSIGRNWIVRQCDAHSWVEAYFPPYGWIEFDPTPIELRQPQTAFMRLLSNLTDALDLWWWEGIVNYDSSKQYRLIGALHARICNFQRCVGSFSAVAYESCRNAASSIASPGFILKLARRWIVWVPWLALAAFLSIRPVRRRLGGLAKRTLHRNNSRAVADSFYTEALSLLGAQGLSRLQGQTPMEFAKSLGSHPASIYILALTRMYNAARFGHPEAQFPHSEAASLLRLLRRSLWRAC